MINKKDKIVIISLNTILLIYIILNIFINELNSYIFNYKVKLWVVMLVMFILELLSTLTFQLRMKLTAKYEITKKEKYKYLIPLIAGASWLIAGFEGILLVSSGDWREFLFKIPPVFIATYLGVYFNLMKRK